MTPTWTPLLDRDDALDVAAAALAHLDATLRPGTGPLASQDTFTIEALEILESWADAHGLQQTHEVDDTLDLLDLVREEIDRRRNAEDSRC